MLSTFEQYASRWRLSTIICMSVVGSGIRLSSVSRICTPYQIIYTIRRHRSAIRCSTTLAACGGGYLSLTAISHIAISLLCRGLRSIWWSRGLRSIECSRHNEKIWSQHESKHRFRMHSPLLFNYGCCRATELTQRMGVHTDQVFRGEPFGLYSYEWKG
jgi:hypothetical protein